MERRAFIKSGCGYCAALASFSVLGPLLEGCAPSDLIYKAQKANGMITVPVESMHKKKYLIVRVHALEYDILLVKDNELEYHALYMQCTHRQQPLVVTSTGLICNEHGSKFDLNGKVLKDPATEPLLKYKAELREKNIVIELR